MTIATMAFSIASGQALSAALTLPGTLVAISVPANWTDAPLSFQTSINGNPLVEVYRAPGSEYVLGVTPGTFTQENENFWGGVSVLAIRSGTVGTHVPQTQAVVLTVSYKTAD